MTYPPQAPPMQYPPQYPPAPAYPQPQYAAPQQYAPPMAPGYPPAQYAPPAAPLAQGSIDDFYSQPSTGGGQSIKFAVGSRYIGMVARPLKASDVQQQTSQNNNQPLFYKDGRPKFVMIVPLIMNPSQEFPDGRASWWVKSAARDELVRAMAEAGAPEGPPEAGAIIDVTCTGERAIPNMNPQKQFRVIYIRPQDAGGALPAQQAPEPQYAPDPLAAMQAQYAQPAPTPAFVPPVQPQPAPQFTPPPVAAQPAPAAAPPAMPPGLSAEQQALLAQITK